jgi:hypothetical protein
MVAGANVLTVPRQDAVPSLMSKYDTTLSVYVDRANDIGLNKPTYNTDNRIIAIVFFMKNFLPVFFWRDFYLPNINTLEEVFPDK